MSGHSWRIWATWSSDSSRERMTREIPTFCQNFTAAELTVLACTERWISISGQASRAIMMRPGSDMIMASGFRAITGSILAT